MAEEKRMHLSNYLLGGLLSICILMVAFGAVLKDQDFVVIPAVSGFFVATALGLRFTQNDTGNVWLVSHVLSTLGALGLGMWALKLFELQIVFFGIALAWILLGGYLKNYLLVGFGVAFLTFSLHVPIEGGDTFTPSPMESPVLNIAVYLLVALAGYAFARAFEEYRGVGQVIAATAIIMTNVAFFCGAAGLGIGGYSFLGSRPSESSMLTYSVAWGALAILLGCAGLFIHKRLWVNFAIVAAAVNAIVLYVRYAYNSTDALLIGGIIGIAVCAALYTLNGIYFKPKEPSVSDTQ